MKRKWGQHLLINSAIAEREVDYAGIGSNDTVLEVGPGKGVLTKLLSERAKRVIAIEIDRKFVDYLRNLDLKNVEIIHADVLDIDLSDLYFNKIVANLPFKISSPFTFKMLDSSFSKAVLIYQKEFARRMVAKPNSKDYSRLSVMVYYKARCRILETIPKTAFEPPPKVDAAMVEVLPREKLPFRVQDEKVFRDLVTLLFSHRRKKIGKIVRKFYGIDIDSRYYDKRAEELSPEDMGEISDFIFSFLHSRNQISDY
ncbi:MAG TPA: ribosomal RNA small subunit methyltransferase A [Thermoplasmatales archaeon]|nr:ribosomal RNA small subunit methyltransferase A [Thermoplasmatales archaeon]